MPDLTHLENLANCKYYDISQTKSLKCCGNDRSLSFFFQRHGLFQRISGILMISNVLSNHQILVLMQESLKLIQQKLI